MEIQTSFIPKKTLAGPTGAVKAGRRPVGLVLFVAVILFLAAVLTHGGVWLFSMQLDNSIANKKDQLKIAEKSFDPGTLEMMSRLNTKITAAMGKKNSGGLLSRHITLIPALQYLEQTTLTSIRFKGLTYNYGVNGLIEIKMTGQARDYESIASQSAEYIKPGAQKYFSDIVFSDLNLSPDGSVTFNFSADADPALFSYHESIKVQ
ncbi:MAG: hypothetical protein HZA95_01680 [Candidatus Vogelbacteria bacterium]|nr:hypothetical protein [Candidatus Vogelbacteria bacterium]